MNKFKGLLNAHPRKRYKSFVTSVADTEMVWLDSNPDKLVPTESCPISVWPEEMFASAICSNHAIFSIEVHAFCKLLMAYPNRLIYVFPNGTDQVDTSAGALLADIEEELNLLE